MLRRKKNEGKAPGHGRPQRRPVQMAPLEIGDGTPVRVSYCRGSHTQPYPPFRHPHVEIQFIKRGTGHCCIAGTNYTFRGPTLLVIPPNTSHSFHPAPGDFMEKWTVMFLPTLCGDRNRIRRLSHRRFRCPPVSERMAAPLENLYRGLTAEYERQEALWFDCVAGDIQHLVALVVRSGLGNPGTSPPNPIAAWAVECIEKDPPQAISLTALAVRAGYSPYYLAHVFKRHVGMSLKQYVLKRRVAEAKRLLTEQPELTIKNTAVMAGFSSFPFFCRSFRKFAGCNPAAYRLGVRADR